MSLKILSDNGTEFKNKLFEQVAKQLGVEYKLYTPPYHPASNGHIEGFHAFLKVCIAKHVAPQLEWDALIPLVLCRAVRGRELEISFLLSFSCLGEFILLHIYIVYCDTQLLVFRFSFLRDT